MRTKAKKDSVLVIELQKLCKEAHAVAKSKGWYETERNTAELMLLMVSEIAEAMEEVRKDSPPIYQNYPIDNMHTMRVQPGQLGWSDTAKPEGEAIELADLFIRLCDFCCYRGIDLGKAIEMKMRYNATRGYRHGNKLF